MSRILSSAAVMIGAFRVKNNINKDDQEGPQSQMGLNTTKTVFGVSNQVIPKPVRSITETS